MSPRLKRLSGRDVIAIFRKLGFEVVGQRGSHRKLVRISAGGERQILTVPEHKELDPGTLHAIVRQASRFVPAEELHDLFYSSRS